MRSDFLVAVTGGTGFIGSHLVDRLIAEGLHIRLLTRNKAISKNNYPEASNIEIYYGDLLHQDFDVYSFLKGVSVLYHCAGEINDEKNMCRLHINAAIKLLNIASSTIDRWVQLSSVGVYGRQSNAVITENSFISPVGEYERTKAEFDEILENREYGKEFCWSILRPANVYGARMRSSSLKRIISMIKNRLFFYIGSKFVTFNYIHVDNVVEALILCGFHKNSCNQKFNLSNTCKQSDLVNIIASLYAVPYPLIRFPEPLARFFVLILSMMPGFPFTQYHIDVLSSETEYPIDRIVKELGYSHIKSQEEGIREMISYF